MDQKKKKRDPYKGIKYLGYRLSQLPNTYDIQDLVKYAKFQLSVKSGRLLKDPIWDLYTVEELLIEFYAHQFEDNEEFRVKFENQIGDINGVVDDFATWAEKKIAEDEKSRVKVMGETEDRVSFDPSQVMGDS